MDDAGLAGGDGISRTNPFEAPKCDRVTCPRNRTLDDILALDREDTSDALISIVATGYGGAVGKLAVCVVMMGLFVINVIYRSAA